MRAKQVRYQPNEERHPNRKANSMANSMANSVANSIKRVSCSACDGVIGVAGIRCLT